MLRSQLDHMVGQILDFAPKTSDIIFTVGKRIQAEVDGELADIPVEPDPGKLKRGRLIVL